VNTNIVPCEEKLKIFVIQDGAGLKHPARDSFICRGGISIGET